MNVLGPSVLATLSALSLGLAGAAGCPATHGASGAAGVASGGACDAAKPCAGALLCVDGRCLERAWPPDAVTADSAPAVIDIAVQGDGAAALADGGGADAADGAGEDGGGEDGADARDGLGGVVALIGDHDALDDPSDDTLTLQVEQAAVTQLFLPVSGQPRAVELLAVDPIGAEGCGRYRPAFWVALADGRFPLAPTWQGATFTVEGAAGLQRLGLDGAPPLPPTALRLGLVFEGLCPGSSRQPILVTDSSGLLDRTWVWVNLGDDSGTHAAWIDGATLQLSGRWALRLELEVASP